MFAGKEGSENRGKGAGVTGLIKVELSDTRDASDDGVAAETTGKFLAEEAVTWVKRKIPGI